MFIVYITNIAFRTVFLYLPFAILTYRKNLPRYDTFKFSSYHGTKQILMSFLPCLVVYCTYIQYTSYNTYSAVLSYSYFQCEILIVTMQCLHTNKGEMSREKYNFNPEFQEGKDALCSTVYIQ